MPMLPMLAFLSTATLFAGSGELTFDVANVSRKAGYANAGVGIEPAPGGDHYEIWRNGDALGFTKLYVLRAGAGFDERWRTELEPTGSHAYFGRVTASATDANGDLVFVTVSANPNQSWREVQLHKVHGDGDLAYTKKLWSSYDEGLMTQMIAAPNGDVVVGGRAIAGTLLRRFSSTGDIVFDEDLGRADRLQTMAVDATGRTYLMLENSDVPSLRALDSAGQTLWGRNFSLGDAYDPRFVDMTVNASGKVVVTGQLQAQGQAGRISVWQYPPDGSAPHYHSIATKSSIRHSAGYRVAVGHGPSDVVYVAWTNEIDQSAWVAKVKPQPPKTTGPRVGKRMGAKGRVTVSSKRATASATPVEPEPWRESLTIGRLRGLTVLSGGRVVVFGGGDEQFNGREKVVEARALTGAGRLVGGELVPSDPHETFPYVHLHDFFGRGNEVYAIGRAWGSTHNGATRVRYTFSKAGGPKPAASATTGSRPAARPSTGKATRPVKSRRASSRRAASAR